MNSHEIQRRLESIGERFVVANFSSYAERLIELCDTLKDDPLCREHYESDIQWSLLSFLLNVARKPASSFGANKHDIGLGNRSSELENNENSKPMVALENRPILDSNEDLSVRTLK